MSLNQAQSPFSVEIDLDHQIYNPGDIINGELKLICRRKFHCQFLTVKLYGSARVFFTELQKTPGHYGQTKAYEQEKILVEQARDVWTSFDGNEKVSQRRGFTLEEITRMASPNAIKMPSSSSSNGLPVMDGKTMVEDNFSGLDMGVHDFKFQFHLPEEGLYTSFDARNSAGYVRYYIIVQASNDGHTVLRRKLLFPVVCPKDLRLDPELKKKAIEPVCIEATKQVEKGEVYVKLEMRKRGYVPGEPIAGHIYIDNRSLKSVKYCFLRIVQRTICCSIRPEMHLKESYFDTAGVGLPTHKVPPHTRFIFPINFYVPALLPSMRIPECIEADYTLRLSVGFKRGCAKYAFLQLSTPILIGTHPTSDAAKSFEEAKQKLPTAPPVYSDGDSPTESASTAPDVPPAYTSSIGGLSETNDSPADKASLLNGEGKKEYAPITYHYNFGYSLEDEEKSKKD